MNASLAFHNSTVYQIRNEHDLIKDFKDELDGYLRVKELAETLEDCKLGKDLLSNIYKCYAALTKKNFFEKKELKIVKTWLSIMDKEL